MSEYKSSGIYREESEEVMQSYEQIADNLYDNVDTDNYEDDNSSTYLGDTIRKLDEYSMGTGIASTTGLAAGGLATGTIEGMAVFGTASLLGYAGGRTAVKGFRKIKNYLDGDKEE